MKLILQLAVCAVLLPLSQIQAKTFGDFTVGQTFRLKVTNVTSTKISLFNGSGNCPVPNGIPKYAKDKIVKFTIGRRGKLTTPEFAMKFDGGYSVANTYSDANNGANLPDGATVNKNLDKNPIGASLYFYKVTGAGTGDMTNYRVTYTLQK